MAIQQHSGHADSASTGPRVDLTGQPMPSGLLARHGAAMARHAPVVAIVVAVLSVAGYLVAAWNHSRTFDSIDEVRDFARQVGAAA